MASAHHHPMIPTDYTTPDTVRALDDATRVGGAIAGLLAALVGASVALRRWWHRKRDRQERVLREVVSSVEERLDALHADVTAIREAQVRHLEAHVAKGSGDVTVPSSDPRGGEA